MSTSFFLLIAMVLGGLLTESGWFIPLILIFAALAIRDAVSENKASSLDPGAIQGIVLASDTQEEADRIAARVAQIRRSLQR